LGKSKIAWRPFSVIYNNHARECCVGKCREEGGADGFLRMVSFVAL
jgi:hypothetical protein